LVIRLEALVLSFFDKVIGPVITDAMMLEDPIVPAKLRPDLKAQIQKFIDSQMAEGFFTHSFKSYRTANYYFQIPSEWARGKNEILCLSIITQSMKPELLKPTLEASAARIKAIPGIFKAFYLEKQANDEDVGKKREALKQSLAKTCQDVLQASKRAISTDVRKERKRDQARDLDRDQTRDLDRDQTRDLDRDKMRDLDRDQSRDQDHDQARDLDRDKTRDIDHDRTRGSSLKGRTKASK
jgi:hypothetical protein